jgi:hypothetical protein
MPHPTTPPDHPPASAEPGASRRPEAGRLVATSTAGGTDVRDPGAVLRIRDTYAVDIAPDQDDLLILAAVLAVDLADDRDRERSDRAE